DNCAAAMNRNSSSKSLKEEGVYQRVLVGLEIPEGDEERGGEGVPERPVLGVGGMHGRVSVIGGSGQQGEACGNAYGGGDGDENGNGDGGGYVEQESDGDSASSSSFSPTVPATLTSPIGSLFQSRRKHERLPRRLQRRKTGTPR
ncbi:unnamed protein product, partial [Closterium sp. NIES-53]